MSLAAADPGNPSPQGRAQWVAEQIFEWAGFGGVHLRIAAFSMENLLYVHGAQIREHGVIRNAFGDYPAPWVAGADVGAEARGDANPRGAAHLAAQSVTLRGRPLPPLTDHVERFTGRPATTFTGFVHARREQFAGAAGSVPGA
jgi:uncharacterized protein YbjT (DUF2867 family)